MSPRLRAHPFVVGQFIARLLPKYFLKLHAAELELRHKLFRHQTLLSSVGTECL